MPYTSIRKFRIWGYSVSHSFLLLRSSYNPDEERRGFNIDIEFVDVDYLDVPMSLDGISIEELKENLPEKFKKYQNSPRFRVFQIKSDVNYYTVAANYLVGKNDWIGEDRMINSSLKYDEILTTYPKRG
jgi:hypothetical protein